MQPIRWRLIFVSFLTLVSLYGIAPTLIYFSTSKEIRNDTEAFLKKIPSWLPQKHVKLGLDLMGGVQLVLGVQTDTAIENRLGRLSTEVQRWAQDIKIPVQSSFVPVGSRKLVIELAEADKLGDFKTEFGKNYPYLTLIESKDSSLTYQYKEKEMERIQASALEQAEKVVRSRVDAWGVTEPSINRRADGSVMVQLPGFRDPEKAKSLLGKTGQLRFQMVDDAFRGFDGIDLAKLPDGVAYLGDGGGQRQFRSESREQLEAFLKPHIPENRELLFERVSIGDASKGKYRFTSFVLNATVALTGDDVQDASVAQGNTLDRRPVVAIKFTATGGRTFAQLTGENVKKRLAIVLEGVVESAATITEKISGGSATISLGNMNHNELLEHASQLALVLKSGAVPATITVLEERQVGATLGPELANQGIRGILAGLLFVFMFMIFYYQRPGAVACLALLLNGIFLLAIMAAFGFAFTLPGIAGFILTLGMAVDSNVLINERIRQELREGRHPRKVVDAGFKKVFWTIIDAHVTTLLAGAVLLETTASGPIRGFAVPLILGLLVSLFTALTCTRLFFDIALRNASDATIRKWFGGEKSATKKAWHFDFLRTGRATTVMFIALSVITIVTGLVRGLNFGVDFAGGTEMVVQFKGDIDSDSIRDVGEKSGIQDMTIQSIGDPKSMQYLVRYEEMADENESAAEHKASSSATFVKFRDTLLGDLKDKEPQILQVDFVGPQVGKDLRNQGAISILYAILAVIMYIALRFDLRFSPGAFFKMFLDVFLVLGFYVFFWVSFDLVAVAAFLTVVGYSMNDTIVIYDRIRENLIHHPRRSMMETVNLSINETLGRSINTSLATMASMLGILIFGSGQIWNFAMAMTIGIIVATISSIFIATSCVVWFEAWRKRKEAKTAQAPAGAKA